jgi:hypothetical protein
MRSARIQSCLSRLASAFVSRACGLDAVDGVCPAVEEFSAFSEREPGSAV